MTLRSKQFPDELRVVRAGCKINFGLHVLGKRDDGYHDIETAILPVPWYDVLTFEPAEAFAFTSSDPRLPTDERNLCVKAYGLFGQVFGQVIPLRMHLEKHLPYGAGLGGGSSDAAAVLRICARLAGAELDDARLVQLALRVGSDVPFFLKSVPSLATGRGERLIPLTADDGSPFDFPWDIVIVTPDVHVDTALAYAGVEPNERSRVSLEDALRGNDPAVWRSSVVNDFESFVFATFPQIARAKESLYGAGALYASLSGSGSAVYGLFERGSAADTCIAVEERGYSGWTGSLDRGAPFGFG